jgi:rhodanese-related sulfurtransferase
VRSSDAYEQTHAQGAINIPHIDMTEERMAEFLKDQVFVVYCWGPGCNGATKAAFKLSGLGFGVKEMIGGIEYWEREGYPVDKN